MTIAQITRVFRGVQNVQDIRRVVEDQAETFHVLARFNQFGDYDLKILCFLGGEFQLEGVAEMIQTWDFCAAEARKQTSVDYRVFEQRMLDDVLVAQQGVK